MPRKKNENALFKALPTTLDKVLAETPCANCGDTALVKIRVDGWPEIQCSQATGCGYVETGFGEKSFIGLMKIVLDEPKTVMRRAEKADVLNALGIVAPVEVPVAPEVAPVEVLVVPEVAPVEAPVVPESAPVEAPVVPEVAPVGAPVVPEEEPDPDDFEELLSGG